MNKEKLSKEIKQYFLNLINKIYEKDTILNVVDANAEIQKIIERVENESWHLIPELPSESGFYYVTVQMKNGKREPEHCYYDKHKKAFFFVAEGSCDDHQAWEEKVDNVIAWQEELKPYTGDLKQKTIEEGYPEIMIHFTKVE